MYLSYHQNCIKTFQIVSCNTSVYLQRDILMERAIIHAVFAGCLQPNYPSRYLYHIMVHGQCPVTFHDARGTESSKISDSSVYWYVQTSVFHFTDTQEADKVAALLLYSLPLQRNIKHIFKKCDPKQGCFSSVTSEQLIFLSLCPSVGLTNIVRGYVASAKHRWQSK